MAHKEKWVKDYRNTPGVSVRVTVTKPVSFKGQGYVTFLLRPKDVTE